jgi:predicted DNA binding protein
VSAARRLYAAGASGRSLAKMLGVSQATMAKCLRKETWQNV